jgi:FixJ family two-component response regulator
MAMQKTQERVSTVYVIDDDVPLRDGISSLLRSVGIKAETFGSVSDFMHSERQDIASCLLLDVRLPGMSGLEFQGELQKLGIHIPIVFLTGHADVPMGVQAIKAGAVEFLCKPFREQDLLDAVRLALGRDREQRQSDASLSLIMSRFEQLTPRERDVMGHVVTGLMNKQIAPLLGVSEITVKVHRASAMRKMNARSLAELVRMADQLGMEKTKPK